MCHHTKPFSEYDKTMFGHQKLKKSVRGLLCREYIEKCLISQVRDKMCVTTMKCSKAQSPLFFDACKQTHYKKMKIKLYFPTIARDSAVLSKLRKGNPVHMCSCQPWQDHDGKGFV